MAGLEQEIQTEVAKTLAAHPDLPGGVCAVDAPRIGLSWRGGADGPLAGSDGRDPAARSFRIASITKPFTAGAIHKLAAAGRFVLADPIAALVSPATAEALAQGGYDPQAIRLSHLLSHTSGIFDHTDAPTYIPAVLASPDRRWTRAEQIEISMRDGKPYGRPGEVYRYSDTGYVILGEIVERASGRSLVAAVPELLGLDALGMAHTWWEDAEREPQGLGSRAHQYAGDVRASDINASFDAYGGGGLVSTVGDLVIFIRALLTGGVFSPNQLAGALATPPSRPPADAPSPPWRSHNLLLATMPAGRHWGLGHTGAWGSAMVYVPAHDAAIAVTLNRQGDAAMQALHGFLARVTSGLDRVSDARRT